MILLSSVVIFVTEKSSHIDCLYGFFLLFFWGGFSGSSSSGGWTSSWTGGGDLSEEASNVGGFECLSEEHWPVWLNLISGCLDDSAQFFSSNFKSIVVEHESSIRAAEFVVFGWGEF
jgi:hypothetical protein